MKYYTYLYMNRSTHEPVYSGSTQYPTKRNSHHKYRCHNANDPGHNYPLYQYMRANGGFDNFEMVIVSQHRSREASLKKERELIEGMCTFCNAR